VGRGRISSAPRDQAHRIATETVLDDGARIIAFSGEPAPRSRRDEILIAAT
jgi:hypothetical protein